MTTAIDTLLTREHLKALRNADRISYHRTPTHSTLTAITVKRVGNKDQDIETSINVESVVRSSREHLSENAGLQEVAHCHELQSVGYGEAKVRWQSILSVVKPGDVLSLHWGSDYATNGYMEDYDLHGDQLSLDIVRGDKRFSFVIEIQCCKDNSARMIRRHSL